MKTYTEKQNAIRAAIDTFPPTFGLRAFPGTFKIAESCCYWADDDSGPILYTARRVEVGEALTRQGYAPGDWVAFAKGTPEDLRAQVVSLPRAGR